MPHCDPPPLSPVSISPAIVLAYRLYNFTLYSPLLGTSSNPSLLWETDGVSAMEKALGSTPPWVGSPPPHLPTTPSPYLRHSDSPRAALRAAEDSNSLLRLSPRSTGPECHLSQRPRPPAPLHGRPGQRKNGWGMGELYVKRLMWKGRG